ncbi:MAG: efflux transporter periplasmic adaptor subunit [Geobacteraceae bacterium GWC2_55_20]|nr:MAG: efflux transporter periplasmic adaptor subunit [Geobacteraceae bacterium GWC2_55_20]OGU21789.1 MAG: efflux transporter periplasmic adaptor subunit [Geobacteraceae bacterium GWF2_54_21]HBA72019.1 efflux RND transporter periplasmic adaptor subunit [Geobacter sp.]HCE66217.1 efflux RND transporter periplasmic adaptor subunit [Geobacter sp.]
MALNKKIAIPLAILIISVSVAGGWLYKNGWFKDDGGGHSKLEHKVQLWTCSMHPFIIKDKPGTCPICGMELIKKLDDAAVAGTPQTPEQKQQADMLGHVSLSPTQRVMANVATVEAKQAALNKEINAVGIVQFDQSRQAKVTAWIAGRIDRLHVNKVGDIVSKDKPVAEVYSPDLVATQQEYLLAVKSREQLKNSPIPSISQNGEGLVASAKQRLLLFGVKESQIAELEASGKPNIRLPIYTPLSGVVIEKMMQQGQYVNTGEVLFNIADLSRVWVEVEVYENEFPNIHIGQQVEIRSQSFPGRPFSGKIAYIYPFLDPKTRTVKARVEMANPGMKLKPDMFVNAIIKVPLGSAIVVPVTAVIDTGKRQVVWVETSTGMFEPRDVQVGQTSNDKIQILSGLKSGDKVAVSGGYLIDSESQLKGGGGVDHSQHTGGGKPEAKGQQPVPAAGSQKPQGEHEGHGSAPAQPAKPAPSAPAKKSLKMDDMKM